MKHLCLLVIASAISFLCAAQNDGSITHVGSLRISKDVKPPILKVVDLSFEEPSGNNAIDAAEECFIIMEIRNEGFGDGVGMVGEITCSDTCGAFSFGPVNIPLLEVGKAITSDSLYEPPHLFQIHLWSLMSVYTNPMASVQMYSISL